MSIPRAQGLIARYTTMRYFEPIARQTDTDGEEIYSPAPVRVRE
jgi:hypothetical protein